MTSSRLTDAHSGLAAPQSPHTLLSGFSQRRSATWLLDRAPWIDEDSFPNQLDKSFEESTERLQAGARANKGRRVKRNEEQRMNKTLFIFSKDSNRWQVFRWTDRQIGVYLKVLYGVMRENECFPVDLTEATFRGTEKVAMPSWKPSLLG